MLCPSTPQEVTEMAVAKAAAKGDVLTCELCGLSVVVDEICGCIETHEVICCDLPMIKTAPRATRKTARPKAAAKPKARAKARKK